MLTAAALRAFAPRCDAETLAPILEAELQRGGINTSLRVCHFLAQVSAETAGLTVFAENLNYSAERLLAVFPRHFDAATAAAYAHQPGRVANRVYAGRMGNGDEASGDGWRYRGRGELEITGRDNYARAAAETGLDLIAHPELLEDPAHGIKAAVDYWTDRHLNAEADLDDIVAITEAINGGLNGIDQRKLAFTAARAIWTDEVVAPEAAPVAATPPPVASATAGAVVVPDAPQAAPAPLPAAAPRPVTDLQALIALGVVLAGLIAAAWSWIAMQTRRRKPAPSPLRRAPSAEPQGESPPTGAATMSDFLELFTPASDPKHLTPAAFIAKEEQNLKNAIAAAPAAVQDFLDVTVSSVGTLASAAATVESTAIAGAIGAYAPTIESLFLGLLSRAFGGGAASAIQAAAATPAGQTVISQITDAASALIAHLGASAAAGIVNTEAAILPPPPAS